MGTLFSVVHPCSLYLHMQHAATAKESVLLCILLGIANDTLCLAPSSLSSAEYFVCNFIYAYNEQESDVKPHQLYCTS